MSPISEDRNELALLTPGHLLRGAALIAVPEVNCDSLSLQNKWQRLKTLSFAKRWKNEYVCELQRRYKWETVQQNLEADDFITIKEDHLIPNE